MNVTILERGHATDQRPWGSFTVLEKEQGFQVKKIVVDAGQRLSLQLHEHRDEHWVVVQGEGVVTIGESRIVVKKSERVFIPKKTKHRVENTQEEPLIFIEVQLGDYLEEDDIVRLEDDYGRL